MRLILLQNGAMIADVVCGEEAVYLGSHEGCRIHLPDARIAAQQAVVVPEGTEGWHLEPLDTAPPLRLNGTLITARTLLKTGDEIQLLDYTVRVYPEFEERAAGRAATLGTSRAQLERFAQSRLPAGAILRRAEEAVTLQAGQLDRLGRTSVSVSGCTAVEELMDAALRVLLETYAAQRVWLGVRRVNYGPMEYEEGRLITGQTTDLPEVGHDLKPRILDRGQFVLVPVLSSEDRNSILAGPLLGPDGTLGLVYVDTGATGRVYDQKDLDFFTAQLHLVAHQLDAIFRTTARNRAAMIDGQVSVAHDIQSRLTPRKLPQWDTLNFGAFRETGRERTGDIYDVVRLSNNLAAFMVAQTPATGSLPSMLIAQAQSAFRVSVMHQDTPAVFLRTLNWLLYDGSRDHPLDCFAGVIDPANGQMRYALAGQVGAYIIGQRGDARRLGPAEPSPPLSLDKNAAYALLPEQLEPGETVVLFTSGVTTAKSRKGETFGEDRFLNIVCDGFGQLASTMLKEMLTDLRNFTEGGVQPDDITVVLAHRVWNE